MPTLLIIVPLALMLVLNLPFLRAARRVSFWFCAILALVQVAAVAAHMGGLIPGYEDLFDRYINLTLTMSGLSEVVLLSIGIVVTASLFTARAVIENHEERFKFGNLVMLAMVGLNGTALLADLISLYVFIEITAVSSFILIAFNRDADGLEGSFKYIILSAVATAGLLSAIALLMMVSQGTSYAAVREALGASSNSFYVKLAMGFFMCGLFIKGGIVPFHWWLPDAYASAPAPASVLLAGIVTKVSGIYTLIIVTTSIFRLDGAVGEIIVVLGAVSAIAGALLALGQRDMKRMLAYSSVSQVGYILLGLGTGSALGIAGAVFHFFNHAIFKSLLFVNATAVEGSLGTRDMDRMGGIASKMPVTGATSLIGFFSAAGIPPLAGFWSKIMIIIALWQTGYTAAAVIAALVGVLTLAYFLSMQRRVFFGKLREGLGGIREARLSVLVPAVSLALITIAAGLFFKPIYTMVLMPIGEMLAK
ncbi:MAG: NADH-quinone oxidoreductase subunit L [Spirochaetes bacterium]|nr:MAG: NADH-quinone oxidoreductase subunit L [Spirochaetota bacterium]